MFLIDRADVLCRLKMVTEIEKRLQGVAQGLTPHAAFFVLGQFKGDRIRISPRATGVTRSSSCAHVYLLGQHSEA